MKYIPQDKARNTIYRVPGTPTPLPLRLLGWAFFVFVMLSPMGLLCLLGTLLQRLAEAVGLEPAEPTRPQRIRECLDVVVEGGVFRWEHFHGDEVFLASAIPDVVVETAELEEEGAVHYVYALTPQPPLATAPVHPSDAHLQSQNGRLRIWGFSSPEEAAQLRDWLRRELGLPRQEFSWELAEKPAVPQPVPSSARYANRSALEERLA